MQSETVKKVVLEGVLYWVADYETQGFQINDDWIENYIDESFERRKIDKEGWMDSLTYGKVRITIERLPEGEL